MSETTTAAVSRSLTFVDTKLYLASAMLIVGNIILPLAVHQIGGMWAGQALLPIYFFSLLGGLMYGWQLGLTVGVLSPLISFGLSGMPPAIILSFVVLKSLILGVVSGALSKRIRNLTMVALLSIVIAQFVGVFFVWLKTRQSSMAFSDIRFGYLGLLLQSFIAPKIAAFFPRHGNQEVPRNC